MSTSTSPPAAGYIRLATASPGSQPTTAATIAQLRQIAVRAAEQYKSDILLLPEAYIGGYPRGSAFGCVVGSRSPEGREEFLRYWDNAVDLGDIVGEGCKGGGEDWVKRRLRGDHESEEAANDDSRGKAARGDGTREKLEAIAAETGLFLVVGCIEKAGGSLYCAAVYVCPKKGMVGKRRKVMPTGAERLIWAQGSAATLRAVSTTIRGVRINLAAAICWENYMPLLRQALYAQNVNLILCPTADGRDSWAGLMRTIGVEGRCFVVTSNMCVRDGSDRRDESEQAPEQQAQGQQTRKRRKSVLDEDGNEIVLCSQDDGNTLDVVQENEARTTARRATSDTKFVSRGGSCIAGPFGDLLAGPQWEDDEGIIFADVDFRDCIRSRLDSDAGGSYSRSDSFKFSVEGLDLSPLPY